MENQIWVYEGEDGHVTQQSSPETSPEPGEEQELGVEMETKFSKNQVVITDNMHPAHINAKVLNVWPGDDGTMYTVLYSDGSTGALWEHQLTATGS